MPSLQEGNTVRGWLQNASLSFRNAAYVASEVYPRILMPTNTAKLWSYDEAYTFRSEAEMRARGSESAERERSGSAINVDTYQYGIKEKITDEDLQDAGVTSGATPPMNMRMEAIESNADQLDLRQEIATAADIVAGTWADGAAGGEDAAGLWAELGSTNTFIADITKGIATLRSKGVDVSRLRLLIDGKTWDGLRQCDDVIDRVKYTSITSVTTSMIAELFNLNKVVIGGAIKNTAKEAATATLYQVWEKNAGKGMGFLYYYPDRIQLRMMAAGAQPVHKMPNGQARQTDQYYEDKIHSWVYESREDIGVKKLTTNAAYLWNDTYTT